MALIQGQKIRYRIPKGPQFRIPFKLFGHLMIMPILLISFGSGTAFGFQFSDLTSWISSRDTEPTDSKATENGTEAKNDTNKTPLDSNSTGDTKSSMVAVDQPPLEQNQGPFSVPEGFEDRVHFWINIYSKYTSDDAVLHDARDLRVVYKVVDLRPISQSKIHPFLKEVKSKKLIQSEKSSILAVLNSLRKKISKHNTHFSAKEEEYYQLLGQPRRASVVTDAISNLRMQLGQKSFYEKALLSSDLYLPTMEKIFANKGLPIELTRVPFVESSFNLAARSRVGASGIWQIMPATGRKLMPNDEVDYRNDPIKATEFAAGLLKFNYRVIDTWPLAVTAYNHGPTSIVKLSKKYNTKDLPTLIKRSYGNHAFAFASSNFYACFLAVLHVHKNRSFYFPDTPHNNEISFTTIQLKKPIKMAQLYKWFSNDHNQAELFNPHLSSSIRKGRARIPSGTVLYVPPANVDVALDEFIKLAKII